MAIFDLLFGFILLLAGRNLFWLCVGVVGFFVGAQCAVLLGFSGQVISIAAALILGIIGAVLAVTFEWVMVMFGIGFMGGGYLAVNLLPVSSMQVTYPWLIFMIGGAIGMALMLITFEWSLILLSSLLGASLIIGAFHGSDVSRGLLFAGCLATGVVVQYLTLKGAGPRELAGKT